MVRRFVHWGAGAVLFFSLTQYMYNLVYEGDTGRMLEEVVRMFECFSNGHWTGWGGWLALLQQIPALLMMCFGLTENESLFHGLAILSLVSFALMHLWGWRSLVRSSERLALLYVVVLLSGPLIWYGHSSFGEMLAAAVTLGFVVACRESTSAWRIVLLCILVTISKDTAFPFAFMLGLMACARVESAGGASRLVFPRWRLLSIATLSGVIIAALFNYMRFGVVFNRTYANPDYIVPTLSIQLDFFLGLWLAPNGGVLFFWPSFGVVMFLAGRSAFRDHTQSWKQAVPFVGTALALIGLTLGFAKWYAPFGWTCWGPRLLLPWLPAAAYIFLAAYASGIERRMLALLGASRVRATIVAAGFALTALPHFIATFRPETLGNFFFSTDDTCPRFAYFSDGVYYYKWMDHHMWTKGPVLLDTFRPRPNSTPILLSLAYGIFIAGLLLRVNDARRELPGQERSPVVPP
jgi:hypothetical protein